MITLPVALALRRRLGGRVVYDARDLQVESSRFARLPGPWRRVLARREREWARSADATLTVNTDVTIVGNPTVGALTDATIISGSGTFRARYTGGVTFIVYRLA
jgi:hypothetical protein